jgi:hypothetical protein
MLCVYDMYLYLPDIFDVLKINIEPPTTDYLLYFDATMLLLGGVVTGVLLLTQSGKFNKTLGVIMITLNLTLTPLFIYRALP